MKYPKLNFIPKDPPAPKIPAGTVHEKNTLDLSPYDELLNSAGYGMERPRMVEVLRDLAQFIQVRSEGKLYRKGFFLNTDELDWVLVKDHEDCLVLVPMKKG